MTSVSGERARKLRVSTVAYRLRLFIFPLTLLNKMFTHLHSTPTSPSASASRVRRYSLRQRPSAGSARSPVPTPMASTERSSSSAPVTPRVSVRYSAPIWWRWIRRSSRLPWMSAGGEHCAGRSLQYTGGAAEHGGSSRGSAPLSLPPLTQIATASSSSPAMSASWSTTLRLSGPDEPLRRASARQDGATRHSPRLAVSDCPLVATNGVVAAQRGRLEPAPAAPGHRAEHHAFRLAVRGSLAQQRLALHQHRSGAALSRLSRRNSRVDGNRGAVQLSDSNR